MSFRFAEPWPLLLGVAALAAVVVVVVLTHRSLRGAVDARSRAILLATRLGAAILLLLLILEPVLSRDRLRTESLSVVLLVDRSRSMSVADSWGGRPRYLVAADFLTAEDAGLLPLLSDEFEIVPLRFDTKTSSAGDAELYGTAAPTGRLTDIAGAIREAARATPRGETVAIVLLSDGAENAGGDAEEAAREAGAPIYAVGFGRRAGAGETRRDLAIVSVDCPETAFAENTVVAEVTVRLTGYDLEDEGDRTIRLMLDEGGTTIEDRRVELSAETEKLPLRFVPSGKGRRTLTVSIPLREDEAIAENNSRTFSVDVLDRRATVLYFDATLRWEAKFLRDFLARDPAIDLTAVLHSGQGRLLVQGDSHGANLTRGLPLTKEGFEKFDVVILGDVEASALAPGQLEMLRRRVEEGGGLLTLGGYHAYGAGGYAGTPLAEALPVFIGADDGQRESAVTLSMTPDGRVHPALSGLDIFFSGRDRPTLEGLTRVRREKPGAQVLLTADAEGEEGEDVVLAVQRYGEGRSAAFTGDTTWVWHRTPGLSGDDGLFRRMWGQILRWLLEREPEVAQAGDPVVLFCDRASYRIGERVRIRARTRDEEGQPIDGAAVRGSLSGPEGEIRLEFDPLRRVPGHYEARMRALVPGEYRATAAATAGGSEIGRAETTFTVEDVSVEMDSCELDDARLAAIARASGGRFYHGAPTAERVAEDIRGSLVGLVEHQELGLSNTPLFFLLFVALVAAEWTLRRRRNLL